MTGKSISPARKRGAERRIEDAIIRHPEALGFPNAVAIRNARVHTVAGAVDVMLLPPEGNAVRLVLVEAKAGRATDSASKVVGQLMMYYAGALHLGADGLELMRAYAHSEAATMDPRKSPKAMTGGKLTPPECAWRRLEEGERLRHDQIKLFIALDGDPKVSLTEAIAVLRDCHGLNIGIVHVDHRGRPTQVIPLRDSSRA